MSVELHSKACLAKAIISAVENFRDHEGSTDFTFRIAAQNGTFLVDADNYLDSGLVDCICSAGAIERVKSLYARAGSQSAQALAAKYLEDRLITPEDYVYLTKWSPWS